MRGRSGVPRSLNAPGDKLHVVLLSILAGLLMFLVVLATNYSDQSGIDVAHVLKEHGGEVAGAQGGAYDVGHGAGDSDEHAEQGNGAGGEGHDHGHEEEMDFMESAEFKKMSTVDQLVAVDAALHVAEQEVATLSKARTDLMNVGFVLRLPLYILQARTFIATYPLPL